MSFLIGILLAFNFYNYQTPGNQAVEQAIQHIKEIENERNLAENYWALGEIYHSICDSKERLNRLIFNSASRDLKFYFSNYPCSADERENESNKLNRLKQLAVDLGSFPLSVYYLVETPSREIRLGFLRTLLDKWNKQLSNNQTLILETLAKGGELNTQLFDGEDSELSYYALLFSNKSREFFLADDLDRLANNWLENFDEDYPSPTLKGSIQAANLIFILYDQNKFNAVYRKLPPLREQNLFPTSIEETRHLNALTYSLYFIGRYDESLKIQREELIPLGNYFNRNESLYSYTFLMAVNLYSLGKFREAKIIFERLNSDSSSSVTKAEIFNNLSICYLRLGEKNKYVSYMLEALQESVEEENYIIELTILRNLFFYYTSIGDTDTALDYLNRAEEIALQKNDHREIAAIHLSKGSFYWESFNDAKHAIQELSLSEKKLDTHKNYFEFIRALERKTEIYIQTDSLDKAEETLLRLKEITTAKSDNVNYVEALINLAKLHLLREEFTEAATILDEIKVYPLDNIDFDVSVSYHSVKATYTFKTGDSREAYHQLRPVIDLIVERAKSSIDTQTGFWTLESEHVGAFNTMISILIETGRTTEAIQILDELKTINDAALYNSPILRANRLSEEDLARDQILNSEIQDLRTAYLNSTSPSDKLGIKGQIDRLSAQREEILNKIRSEIPSKSVPVWALQKDLKNDQLIIHYTEVGNTLYATFISHSEVKVIPIEFNHEKKNLFGSAADKLASGNTDLNKLYSISLQLELTTHIPDNVNSIILIPDNYLYRIPAGALPITKPASSTSFGTTTYLLEKYNIQYFTSLSELLNNSRKKEDNHEAQFSAFAISNFSNFENSSLPSLPYATQEVRDIDVSLASFNEKKIYVQDDATKESFIEHANTSKIVHIATHSEVSEQDPLFSTIYLNSNSTISPVETHPIKALYAYELFDTRMNSDLIMLNSCSSGSGNYMQGSGIMGISRALRYAGAKSLALNLWSVNDKVASDFATTFYSKIDKGFTKPEAMRMAQLKLLKTGDANPHIWAAYMLIGNPVPLTEKPANAGLLYPLLLAVIISVSISLRNRI